ncbi:cell wall metabolism sensor histidine kinase WalK [Cohnella lubricantis]|uniref:histidine kinase n=1 Tax=Cohnella lubricantis TaxID=2163172 RepID=A0A841THZ7_9BACL|nr:cell wall metabolism sensor histidine kinase WalK [Cohnella lubricantis]MBB6679519.1 cell wall metabolism sensor histidine kinase WalK [Cohnella lubricantis]MBP2119261.1 two-component system sensor histidine kinase VicK [Cohnella lubricantis]
MKPFYPLRTIQAKLVVMVLLLILIALQLIGVYFISTMKSSLINNFTDTLNKQAQLLSSLVGSTLAEQDKSGTEQEGGNSDLVIQLVRNLVNVSGAETQAIDASGRVLAASSEEHQSFVGRKNTSLLVSRALQGISDNSEEIIDTDNVRKKVIVKPAMDGGRIYGAVYIVASMEDLYDTMERVNRIFVTGMLLALGLTALLGILIAGTITQPIKALTRQVTAVAEGRFEERVPVLGNDEIGHLSTAFNEMTERLSEALSINEEEKEKLSSILSNMSDGVLATDEIGRVIVANRRANAMLGIAEIEGKTVSECLDIDKMLIAETLRGTESTMLIQRPPTQGDEHLVFRVTLTPIRRRDKGVVGAIAVLHDVTESEKLEQSRREFVANVSHELRTPLTTIKSYAEALDDGALSEPPLAERFVGVIRSETERMIRLVTDLLHLSRFDSRQSQLRRQMTDVSEMIEDVVDRFSLQLRQKAITAKVQVDPGLQKAWLDRDGIDQVLDNVVSNAIKYTLDGGSIDLSAKWDESGQLSIAVKDTGIGIPRKDLDRIFERFYRVDKARSRSMGGTGLGLSIAREIVRAHGGHIALDSEPGHGTIVTITLPATQEGSELA